MNKIFKVVYSAIRGEMVVANEVAASRRRGTKAVAVATASVLMVSCMTAFAGVTPEGTKSQDGTSMTFLEDAKLVNHTWFDAPITSISFKKSLKADLNDSTSDKLEIKQEQSVSVGEDIELDVIGSKGVLQVGGSVTASDRIENKGSMTDLSGKSTLGKVTTRAFWNTDAGDLSITDFNLTGSLYNKNSKLSVDKIGVNSSFVELISHEGSNGKDLIVTGDVYAKNITLNGLMDVHGKTFIAKDWAYIYGEGRLKTLELNIQKSAEFHGLTIDTKSLTVQDGTVTLDKNGNNTYARFNGELESLTMLGNANFQHRNTNPTDDTLRIKTVYLKTSSTSDNYFQTYGGMHIGEVIVDGHGRIDGYSKSGNDDNLHITIGKLTVKKDSEIALSNTRAAYTNPTHNSATIDDVVLEDGASFQNGIEKPDGNRPYAVKIKNLTGTEATVVNLDKTLAIGENGKVDFTGKIDDKTVGQSKDSGVTLSLSSESRVTLLGQNAIHSVNFDGGLLDLSKTNQSLTTEALTGEGILTMDPTKTTGGLKTAKSGASLTVRAVNENGQILTADAVSAEQAKTMASLVKGTNATVKIDEGLSGGAVTVTPDGLATTSVNSVMANSLDIASVSSLSMNRILMNDLRKRLGDIRSAPGTHGAWVRYDGGKLKGSNSLKSNFTTVQVGIDTMPSDHAPRFGLAFAYTKTDADMKRGDADMDSYSLALYGTKTFDNGVFVDVIGRAALSKADYTVDGRLKGSADNTALSLSGEIGWRYDVTPMFFVEPQAEITYTYTDADTLKLGGAASYSFDTVDSLLGRAGFAAGLNCPDGWGNVYVHASAVHEFLGDATIRSGVNSYKVNGEDTWVEYGLGANINIGKNAYVYGGVERTSGATLDEEWRAHVGFRYSF